MRYARHITIVSVLLALTFSSCKVIRFQEYFPAEEGKSYIYRFTNDTATAEAYSDTLISGKKKGTIVDKWIKKETLAILGSGIGIGEANRPTEIFYYEHSSPLKKDSIFINDYSFIGRCFTYYRKALFAGNYLLRHQDEENELYRRIFPRHVSIRGEYIYQEGDFRRIYKIIGFEEIKLNNISLNCLKISISEYFGGPTCCETVWLHKGIGVVKWKKRNGYTGILQR